MGKAIYRRDGGCRLHILVLHAAGKVEVLAEWTPNGSKVKPRKGSTDMTRMLHSDAIS
jgi:hypothetical protein